MKPAISIINVLPTPFITSDGFQHVIVTIGNPSGSVPLFARVTLAGQNAAVYDLGSVPSGESESTVRVPDTHDLLRPGEKTTLTIELFGNEECSGDCLAAYENKQWERTRHWEFYLSQMMHTDLGYTDYQETLRPLFSSYIDEAKENIKNSEKENGIPYRYQLESSWILSEAYAKERDAHAIEELAQMAREGRIAVAAGRFNATMENFGAENTARSVYLTNRILKDQYHIPTDNTIRMFDNPAVSKSFVDVASSAGIRYAIHSMNPDRSPYHKEREYDLFYMTGFRPEHKLLVFNGKSYGENYGFGGNYEHPELGDADMAEKSLLQLIGTLEKRTGRRAYPYDKFPLPLIPFGDNKPPLAKQTRIANEVNAKWKAAGFAYPHIKAAFPEQFFEDVEKEYSALIPVTTGTEENWWNDGWGTTAFESGLNKENGTLVPAAETLSSLAALCCGADYPYGDIEEATDRLCVYNEHTWGYHDYKDCDEYHQQFEWKRGNALGAFALAEKTLHSAAQSIADSLGSSGIVVCNTLSHRRTDLVTLGADNLPQSFTLRDGDEIVPYERDGDRLTFVAKDVPSMGYKLFTVKEEQESPVFHAGTKAEGNRVESPFFTLTLREDGTLASLLDKRNGNREIVDSDADISWNQYQYYDDFGIPFRNMGEDFSPSKWTRYQPQPQDTRIAMIPLAFGLKIEVTTATFRAGSIRQTITLYDDIPRIDIENTVLKAPLPELTKKEEAFYTFPFRTNGDYEIRYDLPLGNAAEGEQVYGTSTDWYTANKWVSVYDREDDYSMTLVLENTALLQFGERRTGQWSFTYKSQKPYIYSYVMNNMWQTNFQGDQPGLASFRYSLCTAHGKPDETAGKHSWDAVTPLQAAVCRRADNTPEPTEHEKSFITLSHDHVLLTDLKPAQANGDGLIVRFHETCGRPANDVEVRFALPIHTFTETDVIENDIGEAQTGDTLRFSLAPYELKTFRIRTAQQLPEVRSVRAVCAETEMARQAHYQQDLVRELTGGQTKKQGVMITWAPVADAMYYEVFRQKNGERFFVGATEKTALFDPQVKKDFCGEYEYLVRAAGHGAKGAFSEPAVPTPDGDTPAGTVETPILHAAEREKNRIDLYWTPVQSDFPLSHYEVYRDGALLAGTTDAHIVSYRDRTVCYPQEYVYSVRAVDTMGNVAESEKITVRHTDGFFRNQDSEIAVRQKKG